MTNGQLIICEGGEGSGKTTLIENLKVKLSAVGHSVVVTREPGGTTFAEEVRALLIQKRSNQDDYPSPRAQLLGYYAARFDHIVKVIKPALSAGKIVLCDRFELSSYVYQVHAQEAELKKLFLTLHADVCDLLKGFKLSYLICDLNPTEGMKRVSKRDTKATYFDDQDLSFHNQVRDGMKCGQEYIDACFKFYNIDASRSPEEMVKDACEVVSENLI